MCSWYVQFYSVFVFRAVCFIMFYSIVFSSCRVSIAIFSIFFFFFNDPATTEIYTYSHTLPLPDALPISTAYPVLRVTRRFRGRHSGGAHRPGAARPRQVLVAAMGDHRSRGHRADRRGGPGARPTRQSVEEPVLGELAEIGRAHV